MNFAVVVMLLFFSVVSAQDTGGNQPDPILILTSTGSIFDQARNELVNELRDEFWISMIEVGSETSVDDLDLLFQSAARPKVVVLIGNNAIRLYKKYSRPRNEVTGSIQVVTILSLDVERAVEGITNVNAVAYEPPMVTALVKFRRVMDLPVTKVGVLYRSPFKKFVDKNMFLCLDENIMVVGEQIGSDSLKLPGEISTALQKLMTKERVDVLWIPTDDVLLKPELLGSVWFPALKKKKVPIIVGIESLVDPKLNFGTFAMIPDPVALGEQAAEIIFNLKLDSWIHGGVMIHPAISMYSVLNQKKATEFNAKDKIKSYEVSKVLSGKR